MTSRLGKFVLTARARARDFIQRKLSISGTLLTRTSRWNQLQNQRDRLFNGLLKAQAAETQAARPAFHGIVFSRDRPLQLDGLINSYFNLVQNHAPLTVLYRIGGDEYRTAYGDIIANNRGRPIHFVEEHNFREDLLTVLEEVSAERVFFLVDDDIFIAPFDMNDFLDAHPSKWIPSLRLGLSLDYCYPADRQQPIPPHQPWKQGLWSWRWSDGKLDWAYPMSVDGNIFSRDEVLLMTRVSDFRAPNSYEEALHSFNSLFGQRMGLCYTTPRLMNIPANRVQTESLNYAGQVSTNALLGHWRGGYRIDCKKLEGFANRSAHQEIDLPLIMSK